MTPLAVPTNSEPLLALNEVTLPICAAGAHSGPRNEKSASSCGAARIVGLKRSASANCRWSV
eukprot:7035783-Prymnesium_polylepis.3